MKKAVLYQKSAKNTLRCLTCQRYCQIPLGQTGFCRTRVNLNGQLYSLTYGLITGIQVDPIEKKPMYHFYPGALIPSIGSLGCNFRCKQCLNYHHSWSNEAYLNIPSLSSLPSLPEQIIQEIKSSRYSAIAFTYNEPAINPEFTYDTAKLAKKEGFKTVFVSNGSWSKEALDYYGKYLDAANIDFKGFSDQTYARMGAFFGQIPEMTEYAQKKHQIFIEITTLLIPGINDDPEELKEMTSWMVKHLGPKTPWHLSQFDPDLAPDKDFQKIPFTSIDQLEKAYQIGKKAGLEFIYIWAPHDSYSKGDTICPKCKTVCVKRTGWQPKILAVDKKGNCQKCGENLNIRL